MLFFETAGGVLFRVFYFFDVRASVCVQRFLLKKYSWKTLLGMYSGTDLKLSENYLRSRD